MGWQRNGKIDFENVSIQHEPGSTSILKNINLSIAPGEKVTQKHFHFILSL